MKKLLILGTSYGTADLVRSAQAMGLHTIVADTTPFELSLGKQAADEYWMTSTSDMDELCDRCTKEGVDYAFAGVSEFNLDQLIVLTKRLNLPCYINENAWKYARDKHLFKDVCRRIGMNIPEEFLVTDPDNTKETAQITYPVVVKPTDSNYGQGLTVCDSAEDLSEAYRNALKHSASGRVVVERFVRGDEYSAQYLIAQGEGRLLFFQRLHKVPAFSDTRIFFLSDVAREAEAAFMEQMDVSVREYIRETGCRDGIITIQTIRDKDGIFYAIEPGHRLSGDTIYRVFCDCNGFDTYRWMLEISCGVTHTVEDLEKAVSNTKNGFNVTYGMVTGRAGVIKEVKGIETVAADPAFLFDSVRPARGEVGKGYGIGKFSFTAPDEAQLCRMVRVINENIKILDENGENMMVYFDDYSQIDGSIS